MQPGRELLVEPQNQRTSPSAGFSAGSGEPTTTNINQPTTDSSTKSHGSADDSKPDDSEYATDDGYPTAENEGSNEYELDDKKRISKSRNIPKSQAISVVYNYSKLSLTQPMENLLNKGFNFSILPLKLDLTQVQGENFQKKKK